MSKYDCCKAIVSYRPTTHSNQQHATLPSFVTHFFVQSAVARNSFICMKPIVIIMQFQNAHTLTKTKKVTKLSEHFSKDFMDPQAVPILPELGYLIEFLCTG